VWIGSKGSWTFNFGYQKDMKNYMITPNSSAYQETSHPTEKPLQLIQYFIEHHSNTNDIVLDCFLGSGTTAIACIKSNRNFIGIELSQHYCNIANKRIKLLRSQYTLI
jgi:DNA modification methylase